MERKHSVIGIGGFHFTEVLPTGQNWLEFRVDTTGGKVTGAARDIFGKLKTHTSELTQRAFRARQYEPVIAAVAIGNIEEDAHMLAMTALAEEHECVVSNDSEPSQHSTLATTTFKGIKPHGLLDRVVTVLAFGRIASTEIPKFLGSAMMQLTPRLANRTRPIQATSTNNEPLLLGELPVPHKSAAMIVEIPESEHIEPAVPTTDEAAKALPPDEETPDYGTMPKLAGEAALGALLVARHTMLDDKNLSPYEIAQKKTGTFTEVIQQTMEWGWNIAAVNEALDMFNSSFYPAPAAAIAVAAGTPVTVKDIDALPTGDPILPLVLPSGRVASPQSPVPAATRGASTYENQSATFAQNGTRPNRHRWIKPVALILAGAALLGLGIRACTDDTGPLPQTPAASASVTPTPTETGHETDTSKEDKTDKDKDKDKDEEATGKPVVHTMLNGAQADTNGDFVRVTPYANRHGAREKGTDFSTVWWIASEQLDAVNGKDVPTAQQIWEFTGQTLKLNNLTWSGAHDLEPGQKIRLLPDGDAKKVIETNR